MFSWRVILALNGVIARRALALPDEAISLLIRRLLRAKIALTMTLSNYV
jgi:hypothetical protein